MRKRGRGRGKYAQKGPRCSWAHPGGRARGWGGVKGKKWKGRRREDGHRPLTQTNAYVTPREDDLLSIVDSISEASGQLTHPRSPTRRLQGHGSLNMKYAPLIVHGYPPYTIPWRDRFKKWPILILEFFIFIWNWKISMKVNREIILRWISEFIVKPLDCGFSNTNCWKLWTILWFFVWKNSEEKLKILSSKPILQVEKTIRLKLLFELFRYLKRLPRYKDSKFP